MSIASAIETAWQFAVLMLVQSTLLIAGVYLTVKLLRLREAALLSVIYRSILLATLAAPLATIVMMRSEIVGWWPHQWGDRSLASIQPILESALPIHVPESTVASKASFAPLTSQSTMESLPPKAVPNTVKAQNAGRVRLPDFALTAKTIFCLVWVCVSLVFLVRLWRTHRQLWRTLSKAIPVDPSIQAFCDRLAFGLQVSSPRVVCSPYFTSPFLTGSLHPIIHLSSEGMDDLDHDRSSGLRDILIHELAHLKRRDVSMRMFCQLVLSIFFFQPLLRRLVRWLESSAEDVCDDYAISFGARRDHYAGRLVDLAEYCDFPLGSAVGIASGKSMLMHRVSRIMNISRKPSTRVSYGILTVCGLVTAAAVFNVCLLFTPAQEPVVDAEEAFERLTAIENVVHTEQREGLIFTIHQAKRFENGGVLIMSTVRGTDETLEHYPLTRRNLFTTEGPAKNWHASPQEPGYFRLILAEANHRGVDAQWWVMVPRGRLPNWFEDKDGKVQLDIGVTPQGEYAKANHKDERGFTKSINWKLPLDISKSENLPSLDEIAASVHSDLNMLTALSFPRSLHMGVKDVGSTPTSQFGSPDYVSAAEFATATREHWQWWERGDVDFQFKSGGTSYGYELGDKGLKPALLFDYISVVDDSTLARAPERSNLVVISARGTKITDAGLAHLTELTKLKELNIANTSISDEGLRYLESIKSLERLDVTDTKVTPAGIERLRKSLPNVDIVTQDKEILAKPSQVAKSDNEPLPLPSKLTGIVIDSDDKPIANAQVTLLIRTFSKDMHEELKGPLAFTAMTDENGLYSLAPTGTVHPNNEVRIKVVAKGFADVSDRDYEKRILKGVVPTVRMLPGRQISGRLVGDKGIGVAEAIVRFQCANADRTVSWDSGPFPVDPNGRFSLSIPSNGNAVGAVYPKGLAPRFVDVTSDDDQGEIYLEKGVTMKGRVVDKNGRGIANSVVGIGKTEYRVTHGFMAVIGTAVRTDDSGYFQLPPLSGEYKLSVGRSVPDYSRQMMLDGDAPPSIEPVTIKFDSATRASKEILLKEKTP